MSEAPQESHLLVPTASRFSGTQPRRLSSMPAQREDLFTHPAIMAPPDRIDRHSNAHETAYAMEMAKHHLAEDSDV